MNINITHPSSQNMDYIDLVSDSEDDEFVNIGQPRTKQVARLQQPREPEHMAALLTELYNGRAQLQDRTLDGRSGKQRQDSFGISTIKKYYPNSDVDCGSLGKCLVDLMSGAMKTTADLVLLAPLLRRIVKYAYKNPGDFYDGIKRQFPDTVKNARPGWRDAEKNLLSRNAEETSAGKAKAAVSHQSKQTHPVIVNYDTVLKIIHNGIDSNDPGELGAVLEMSCAMRALDMADPSVNNFRMGEDGFTT